MTDLLTLDDVSVAIGTGPSRPTVVDRVSFTVAYGETVALVGESGSGKSITARAIVGLLPTGAHISSGRIVLDGRDLMALSARQMDGIRGARIGMVFQQPQVMLDPTCRVGVQVAEPLRRHHGLSRAEADARVLELLRDVGIADPELRARSYAHELSGGLAQRVMIAAALSADPDLLIADEPTTALDVTVQAQILRLLDEQRRARKMSILLITHDFSVVAAVASRVVVMYAGRIVEEGPTAVVLRAPRHPYTRALVACSLLKPDQLGELASIRGAAQLSQAANHGCRFHARCDVARAAGLHEKCCANEPELQFHADGTRARCWASFVDVLAP
jgi:peptide/nickel transport system ATP-binding protein